MMQVSNVVLELFERIEQRLGRIERNIHMVDHTLEELKDAQDAMAAKIDAQGPAIATVKADVEAILAKLAAIPTQGLTAQQQTLVNEMVETAQSANTKLDAAADALKATDAEANPPAPEPAPAPVEPPAEPTA